MNYNNKPKPAQANLLENMMSRQKDDGVQVSRSGGLAVWRPLHRVLFVVLLATAAPVAVYASEGNILTNSTAQNTGKIPALSTPSQPNTQPQPIGAAPSDFPTKLETLEKDVTTLKKQEEDRQQKEAQTTPLWKKLLFILLAILGLAGLVLLRLSKSKQLQEKLKQLTEQNEVNAREIRKLSKKQQEQVTNELLKLQNQLVQLERRIQQQQPIATPIVVTANESLTDFPTLQSEFTPSKPLVSIDADDRKVLQQAFLEWRANSRSKKIHDFLPSSFLEKIRQLGYEIVFAKAGVGLERMIIDRKPPSNTRMVGLSSMAHSIMYCYNKTYEGDECWTPDTWYEVSIDSPDAADEQTVHKGKEL